jgi:hypothetical protein
MMPVASLGFLDTGAAGAQACELPPDGLGADPQERRRLP